MSSEFWHGGLKRYPQEFFSRAYLLRPPGPDFGDILQRRNPDNQIDTTKNAETTHFTPEFYADFGFEEGLVPKTHADQCPENPHFGRPYISLPVAGGT